MLRPTLALASALALALVAGCISPDMLQKESTSAAAHAPPPPVDRIDGMTADVQQRDTAVDCASQELPLPASTCYQRDVLAKGQMGVDRLPVDLTATNGAISLSAGEGDAWVFHAVVKVRGSSPDAAKRNLDTMWSWSHTDGSSHFLRAAPNNTNPAPNVVLPLTGDQLLSVRYEVTLPAWVLTTVKAHTTNGAIAVHGIASEVLDLHTTNGGVAVEAPVKDLDLATTNGGIAVALDPVATGKVDLHTTNGGVAVTLPEDAAHGYQVDAKTTNGRVEIQLHDGKTTAKDKTHATFTTEGLERRAVRTTIDIATTNGGVTVGSS